MHCIVAFDTGYSHKIDGLTVHAIQLRVCGVVFVYFLIFPLYIVQRLSKPRRYSQNRLPCCSLYSFFFLIGVIFFPPYAVLYLRQAILARSMASLSTEFNFFFFFTLGSGFRGLSFSLLLVCGYL